MSTKIILLFSLALDDTSSEAKKGQGPTIINLIEDFYPRNAHSRAHVSRFANFFASVSLNLRQAGVELCQAQFKLGLAVVIVPVL